MLWGKTESVIQVREPLPGTFIIGLLCFCFPALGLLLTSKQPGKASVNRNRPLGGERREAPDLLLLPLTSCVAGGKPLTLSGLPFPGFVNEGSGWVISKDPPRALKRE